MNTSEMLLEFDSKSQNEGFARTVIAAFISRLNPTLEEIADIKTAVSEAVTNSILHGYEMGEGKVQIRCQISGQEVTVEVIDSGVGIEDIEKAKQALYTTRPEWERSGMGFVFMETFMDSLIVESARNHGTKVQMKKMIGGDRRKNWG